MSGVPLKWIEAKEGEAPRFRIKAYRGEPLQVNGFDYPVVVELSSAEFEGTEQTYINRHHDQKRELGHTTSRSISANEIIVEGVFSHDNDDTREIVTASQRGKQFKASIEARFPPARFVKRGSTVVVNGKRHSGPVYVARNAKITGVAILTRAADMTSDVQIAAKERNMNEKLREYIEAKGFDPDTLSDDQVAFFEGAMPTEKQPEQKLSASPDQIDWESLRQKANEEQAAHAEYRADVRRLCAQFGEPEISLPDGSNITLEAHALKNNMPIKEVELSARLHDAECKTGLKAGGSSFAIHDAGRHDENMEVVECALGMSSRGFGEEEIRKHNWYSEETVNAAMDSRYRGYRPSRLVHMMLAKAGIYHPQGQFNDEYISAMQRATNKLEASSGFTTASIPRILSNVQNKTLMSAYMRAASLVPFCFGTASASDFKPLFSYQLEGSGMLEKIGADGEIKHGKVIESEYTKQLETFAKMLSWTRKMMINDDLMALSRTSQMLGVMAYKAREYAAVQFLYSLSQGATPFFSSDNANLLTANPLSIDGLTASGVAFDAQTDYDGLPISVDGPRILAPASLKVITAQLQNQTEIRDNLTDEKVFINNPHAGNFTAFNSQWVENAIANPSANLANEWYRFSDPSVTPAMEVVYLNGNPSPVVSSEAASFNVLGLQFRAVFDFGFGSCDHRYAQLNRGV